MTSQTNPPNPAPRPSTLPELLASRLPVRLFFLLATALLFPALLLLAGCGSDSGPGLTPPEEEEEEVAPLAPDDLEILSVRDTFRVQSSPIFVVQMRNNHPEQSIGALLIDFTLYDLPGGEKGSVPEGGEPRVVDEGQVARSRSIQPGAQARDEASFFAIDDHEGYDCYTYVVSIPTPYDENAKSYPGTCPQ